MKDELAISMGDAVLFRLRTLFHKSENSLLKTFSEGDRAMDRIIDTSAEPITTHLPSSASNKVREELQ